MASKSDIKEYQFLRKEGPVVIIGRPTKHDILVKPISANKTGSYLHCFESGGRFCATPEYFENGERKPLGISSEVQVNCSGAQLGLSGMVEGISYTFTPNICSVLPNNLQLKVMMV
ncbi:MAG: hypothetical protein AABX01_07085 [Candidatus Micrarchaeota archaeon]